MNPPPELNPAERLLYSAALVVQELGRLRFALLLSALTISAAIVGAALLCRG